MKRQKFHPGIVVAVLLSVILTIAAIFVWRSGAGDIVKAPEEIEDYLFWEAKELADFKLTAADNKTFDLDSLKGKWSFIFFGYTHCPTICPTNLQHMAQALEQLGDEAVQIQPIFITIDPARDTPGVLKDYVAKFGGANRRRWAFNQHEAAAKVF